MKCPYHKSCKYYNDKDGSPCLNDSARDYYGLGRDAGCIRDKDKNET